MGQVADTGLRVQLFAVRCGNRVPQQGVVIGAGVGGVPPVVNPVFIRAVGKRKRRLFQTGSG
jgi:hypothetical protein